MRFESFAERERATLAESLLGSTHHMKAALQEAVLDEKQDLCGNACHIILLGRVYQSLPTLVKVAEHRAHRHSDQAAATLVQLARLLQGEFSRPAQERSCDPFFTRREVLPPLERSFVRFGNHQRLEITDAFLLLVPPSNATLLRVLDDPKHACYAPVTESLASSPVTAMLDLLAQMLHDTKAPSSVLHIIAHRRDRKFLDLLLHQVGTPVSLRVLENMRRLSTVPWLSEDRTTLLELDGPAQAAAVELALATNIRRNDQFELFKMLITRGEWEARRASCDALGRFQEPQAAHLVREALRDPDPRVKAAAARQSRRRTPDATKQLVTLLEDPAPEVRAAARSSLAEFNFARYHAAFDKLNEKERQTQGRMVLKVDPTAPRRLIEQLSLPAPSARRRGLEMVAAMDAADAVFDHLVAMLDDSDLTVRTDAALAMGRATGAKAMMALRRAERDPNRIVRDAAQKSIDRLVVIQSELANQDANTLGSAY